VDFSAALEEHEPAIRATQIIVVALAFGAVSFLGVVAVLTQTQPAAEATLGGAEFIQALSLAHVFMAPSCWMAAFFLYRLRVSSIEVHADADAAGILDDVLGELRSATILVMALFEGPALFGIVIVFLAHTNGSLPEVPYAWGGLLSTAMMMGAASAVIPTNRRLEALGRELHQKAGLT
jgi:hypothetical protein